ncbi:hypothetical protein BSKO_11729 [Bryopsis sp. KO-2023]|nr:hypothetical protein BSKO_11729 [Bryopsis sp. KO-2023]
MFVLEQVNRGIEKIRRIFVDAIFWLFSLALRIVSRYHNHNSEQAAKSAEVQSSEPGAHPPLNGSNLSLYDDYHLISGVPVFVLNPDEQSNRATGPSESIQEVFRSTSSSRGSLNQINFYENAQAITCCNFSVSCLRIASGHDDGSTMVWSTEHGFLLHECKQMHQLSPVADIRFLKDSETVVVSCDFHGRYVVWDATLDGQVLASSDFSESWLGDTLVGPKVRWPIFSPNAARLLYPVTHYREKDSEVGTKQSHDALRRLTSVRYSKAEDANNKYVFVQECALFVFDTSDTAAVGTEPLVTLAVESRQNATDFEYAFGRFSNSHNGLLVGFNCRPFGFMVVWNDYLENQTGIQINGTMGCWSPKDDYIASWDISIKGSSGEKAGVCYVWSMEEVVNHNPTKCLMTGHSMRRCEEIKGIALRDPQGGSVFWADFIMNRHGSLHTATCVIHNTLEIILWDLDSRTILHRLTTGISREETRLTNLQAWDDNWVHVQKSYGLMSISLSGDGNWLGIYSADAKKGYVWSSDTGIEVLNFTIPDRFAKDAQGKLLQVDMLFSSSGSRFAVYSEERILLWNPQALSTSTHDRGVSRVSLQSADALVSTGQVQCEFSLDGNMVGVCRAYCLMMSIWDLSDGRMQTLIFPEDNAPKEVASFYIDTPFLSSDVNAVESVRGEVPQEREGGSPSRFCLFAFSHDGSRVATCMADVSVLMWELDGSKIVDKPTKIGTLRSKYVPAWAMCFSVDAKGRETIVICEDCGVLVWLNIEERKVVGRRNGLGLRRARFSREGTRGVLMPSNDVAHVWDLVHRRKLQTVTFNVWMGPAGQVPFPCNISADGTFAFVGAHKNADPKDESKGYVILDSRTTPQEVGSVDQVPRNVVLMEDSEWAVMDRFINVGASRKFQKHESFLSSRSALSQIAENAIMQVDSELQTPVQRPAGGSLPPYEPNKSSSQPISPEASGSCESMDPRSSSVDTLQSDPFRTSREVVSVSEQSDDEATLLSPQQIKFNSSAIQQAPSLEITGVYPTVSPPGGSDSTEVEVQPIYNPPISDGEDPTIKFRSGDNQNNQGVLLWPLVPSETGNATGSGSNPDASSGRELHMFQSLGARQITTAGGQDDPNRFYPTHVDYFAEQKWEYLINRELDSHRPTSSLTVFHIKNQRSPKVLHGVGLLPHKFIATSHDGRRVACLSNTGDLFVWSSSAADGVLPEWHDLSVLGISSDKEKMKELLDKFGSGILNFPDHSKMTIPMHVVLQKDHEMLEVIVDWAVEKGVLMALSGEFAIAGKLGKTKAQWKKEATTALDLAVAKRSPECVEILLTHLAKGLTSWSATTAIYNKSLLKLSKIFPSAFHALLANDALMISLPEISVPERTFHRNLYKVTTSDVMFPSRKELQAMWKGSLGQSEQTKMRVVRSANTGSKYITAVPKVVPYPDIAQIGMKGFLKQLMISPGSSRHNRIYNTFVIKALIHCKWKVFGRRLLTEEIWSFAFLWLIFTTYALLLGTLWNLLTLKQVFVSKYRETVDETEKNLTEKNMAAAVLLLLAWVIGIFNLLRELTRISILWMESGMRGLMYWAREYWNWVDLMMLVILVGFVGPVHFWITAENEEDEVSHDQNGQKRLTVLVCVESILLSWKMLHFAQAFRSSAPMVIMIREVLKEISVFLLIAFGLLFGFAISFFVLFRVEVKRPRPEEVELDEDLQNIRDRFENIGVSIVTAVQMMLGETQLDVLQGLDGALYGVGTIMFVVYLLAMMVVLLNLLIAVMGDSFERVKNAEELQFLKGRAQIIDDIESMMSNHKKKELSKKIGRYLHVLVPKSSIEGGATEWGGRLVEQNKLFRRELGKAVDQIKYELRDNYQDIMNLMKLNGLQMPDPEVLQRCLSDPSFAETLLAENVQSGSGPLRSVSSQR